MNKFLKSIAITILSSIALLSAAAHAQDKFGIKEGSYIGELLNEEKSQVLARAYAQIVIEKDGMGSYRQTSATNPCYKGERKLSQKRDPSGQLIFEVKPNNDKEKCVNSYYIVKKMQGRFITRSAIMDSKGNYVSASDLTGNWTKD